MADETARGRHILEERLNTSADDILTAILGGFRAIIDVKGKLAEYFLKKELEALKDKNLIEEYTWSDKDGRPDFSVRVDRVDLLVEAKNVRTPDEPKPGARTGPKVELQETRNSKDETPSRGYRPDPTAPTWNGSSSAGIAPRRARPVTSSRANSARTAAARFRRTTS